MNTVDEIADALGKLSITDTLALTRKLEAEWGVSATAAAPVPLVGLPPGTGQGTPPEQTEWTVTLKSIPNDRKIGTIKAVREHLALGLAQAKEFTEGLPRVLKEGLPKAEAEAMVAAFQAVGAEVVLS